MIVSSSAAHPTPVRTWRDPDTGATVHQLTDGPEPAGPLYFTRGSWTPDGGRLLYLRQRNGRQALHAAGRDGGSRRLTDLPPASPTPRFVRHMHRSFLAEEIDKLMLRLPAVHPTRPLVAYAWRNQVRLVDLDRGSEELLLEFSQGESSQPATGLHTVFTADGELILVTLRACAAGERIDPPDQAWDFSLRDESGFIGTIWRYDLESRRLRGPEFSSNGEQSHLLTCPWDPELLVWVNYLHGSLYAMRRGESRPRALVRTSAGGQPNHYSWDVGSRRLVCCVGIPPQPMRVISIDVHTGDQRPVGETDWAHPGHISVSPDGRWIALDVPHQGFNGLHLIDQRDGSVLRLCRIDCTWNPTIRDQDGGPVKSELLHPNPSWSPDGRSIAFGSDFGSGIGQLHVVDVGSWLESLPGG